MTRSHLVAIISTALLALPLVSFAQENQPPQGGYCPHITQNLKRGDTDATTQGQVTELQKFLVDYYDLNPNDYISGYFGRRTQENVMRFQRDQNITPVSGYVGPLTRAAIARVCGQTTSPPQNLSCQTPWGTTIQNNTFVTAYQSPTVPAGQQCQSQTRLCTNGNLSGSYQYQTCSVATTSCTPENPQTQTLSCPTGQTGSIIQTRTSTCPGPTWGAWVTTSNTCTTPPVATNVGSCTYKGQSYAEGNTISFQISPVENPQTLTCDNEVWVTNASYVGISAGLNVCDYKSSLGYTSDWSNLCANQPSKPHFAVVPRHGKAPLTVTTTRLPGNNGSQCSYSISWGDGSTDSEPSHACNNVPENGPQINSHTYASRGSYSIQFQATGSWAYTTGSNSANIRVDPAGTASAQNQSQLANALSALESALKAILQLLQ